MPRSTTPRAKKEHRSAGEAEDDSCTRKKKSRRVSFAETTVHVFNRDESSGSPAGSKPSRSVDRRLSYDEETVGFRGHDSHGDDSVGSAPEEEDEEDGARLRFVADMDSSSPGSAIGSVTSNEDDNFFGPVSSSFINSGCLSESGMSDDNNHDVTLDSTAFSLHFRNIAPPDDLSANSAGSLKTPTGDTTSSMPLGFLVRGDTSEELETKHSVGTLGSASVDWNKISPILRGSDKHDYGKYSETLEALMDQVNMTMQPNSPNEEGIIKSSRRVMDKIGPEKDGAVIGNHDSFYDESGRSIHYPYLPMGQPSNETLSSANAEALTSHSNSEKIEDSLMVTDDIVKVHVAIDPEIMIPNGQKSNPPQNRVLENDLNIQSSHIHQKLSRKTSEGECYPASSLYCSSAFLSMSEDAQKQLEPECIADTCKNAVKLFHSSPLPESMSTSEDQQQQKQQIVSQPVPSSSKFMCVSDRGDPESLMETPANAVKTFHLLQGSVSSFLAKQRQLLDFSVLPQSELMHTPRDQSASLKLQLIEHGERISSIKNHITSSRVKTRIQTDYEPASSRKDHFITNLTNILDEIIDLPCMNRTFTSDMSVNAKNEYPAKQMESMNISNELDRSGNASYLTGLDKNAAVFATVENAQTERMMEFHCNSPLKVLYTLGAHSSSVENGIADPNESNQALNISSKQISAAIDISAAECWDGCVTLGADENTRSSYSFEAKNSQLTTTKGPYTEKVNNLENIKVPLNSDSYGWHEKLNLAVSECFHSGGLCMNTKLNGTLANMAKKITGRQMIDPYCKQASGKIPELNATLRQSLESSSEEIVCCPNDMANCRNDNFHSFNSTDVASPKSSQAFLSHVHGLNHRSIQFQQESYSGCDVSGVGCKGKKQTCHKENADGSASDRIQNSSVTIPDIVGDSGVVSVDPIHHDEAHGIVGKASQKHWNDVLSRASAATNELLPHSISEQHLHKLNDVEDLLTELQTARKYNGICFTLRNHKCFSDLHQKRVIDARLLLEKLGFAKARNELKHLKLKKLHDKAKLLQSKVEECKKLKSIYSQLCVLIPRAVEPHELYDCRYQEAHNRVMAMRREIEMLEQKIKPLLKSFETSFKLKGKMSCDDVIKTVDENLMRRALCKDIQEHTQLWKLSDVGMINNHYEIVLGYCNVLFQRFTIDKNQVIVANNSCNKENLGKKFPNMNACVAFDFVIKLNFDRKLATSNCIYQETVETNLMIGALIAVLEEILVSRLEFWNLISSTFLEQFSGELQFQLCFYSSRSGQRITLGLDMTSLNRGIYPADPSVLKIQVDEQQTTLSPSIVDKVIGAARSLQGGHFVILRLCRCISQVVQCST